MEIVDFEQENKVRNCLVRRKWIEWVAHNFEVSEHAEYRQIERDYQIDRDFKRSILESPLAWKVADNRTAIALDLYNYIIVTVDKERGVPIIVTFATTKNSRVENKTVEMQRIYDYKRYMKGEN